MKISTKGRYGLRAVLYLALHGENSHVALHQIAENQSLSVGYTEQIFSTLRRSGIVKSVKGAQGGYVLSDHPKNITIGSVLRALEGDLSLNIQDPSTSDNPYEQCICRTVWAPLDSMIFDLLDHTTLESLMEDFKQNDPRQFIYMI